MLIDLKGEAVFTNWYDYLFATQRLAKATSAGDVHRLMREQHITKFISFKPGLAYSGLPAPVAAFLAEYTEPEFSAGDVYVARYKQEFRFSEDVLKNGNFAEKLESWSGGDPSMFNAATRIVSVTSLKGLVQRVAIDERLIYRYGITARCVTADTQVRLWVNWYDAEQHHLYSDMTTRKCSTGFQIFDMDLSPQPGVRFADILAYGHEADKIVEVSDISFKW
jgi:hypothetical protein